MGDNWRSMERGDRQLATSACQNGQVNRQSTTPRARKSENGHDEPATGNPAVETYRQLATLGFGAPAGAGGEAGGSRAQSSGGGGKGKEKEKGKGKEEGKRKRRRKKGERGKRTARSRLEVFRAAIPRIGSPPTQPPLHPLRIPPCLKQPAQDPQRPTPLVIPSGAFPSPKPSAHHPPPSPRRCRKTGWGVFSQI